MNSMQSPFAFVSRARRAAFSLVEVVVAVGIFAIAVVACIGLLGPINNSVASVKDGDDASRVVAIVQAELQRLGITTVSGYIGQTLYANRTGDKIGRDNLLAPWDDNVPDLNGDGTEDTFEIDAQKFFEVKISANPEFTFNSANDGFLALNLEIRWPGYTAQERASYSAGDNRIEDDARDQQSILVFPVAITR